MPINVKYTRLTPVDNAPATPGLTETEYVVIQRSSVYELPCMPVCKVVNYDSLPGTICGKGCFGFVGSYVPAIAGIITAGLGMAGTAIAMSILPNDDQQNSQELAFAFGSIASVALGAVVSAIGCYRSSLCCDGPDIIKHKVDIEAGKQIVLKDI